MTSTDCLVSEYTEDTSENENFKAGETSENTISRTELESLIEILKKGIKKNEPAIKFIKYPDLLVSALEELNGLVGLDRLKDSVAIQTVRLIENLKMGEKSMAMLNTILSGVPGVGKTRASVILAKIWFALGFLDTGTTKVTVKKKTVSETPIPTSGADMSALVLLLIAWGGTYLIQMLSFIYNKIGLFWLGFIFGLIILVIIFIYWGNTDTEWIKKYLYEQVTHEDLKNVSDRDIISVVSRNDFVGEYLGHTAGKTKRLLEANIGKVLFIDEAYSLINDPRDAYGYECLNTLNLFLSENPDKIVVIFAGYKDQMKSSIFTAQPGLERRIMWKFDCDPYSGEELAEIFFIQAKKEGWYISNEDMTKIKKLIIRNESAFPAFGGDTERLVYLSSLEASRSNLTSISDSFLSTDIKEKKQKILSYRDVELGLITLKENKL